MLCTLALYTAKAQTIDNSGLETWKTYSSMGTSLQRPDHWFTSDSLYRLFGFLTDPTSTYISAVTQELTITHSGSSAAKLVTSLDTQQAYLSNADLQIDFSTFENKFVGGTAVTSRIVSASGWVRYNPAVTSDSGGLAVYAIKDGFSVTGEDSIIGEGVVIFGQNSAYTKVTADIEYFDATTVPDRIVLAFLSSTDDPHPGSILYADDATLTSGVGIETPVFNQRNIHVYPNPATDVLTVTTDLKEAVTIRIYAVTGQQVIQQQINGTGTVAINELPSGNYIYVVSALAGSKLHSATFVKK